jgi:hypothetical protein
MAMDSTPRAAVAEVPPSVERVLAELVKAAQDSFQDDLSSVVLFGSGAEGRLRTTSDLNLLVVLKRFQQQRVDKFREPLRLARVTAQAGVMFVLDSELAAAAEAFAVKFGDIARRCRVLFGDFPIASLAVSREAKKQRLRQILLNLSLRLRQSYAMTSLREEQLATVIADTAGPLRVAAATLLELEKRHVASPKESLETVARSLNGQQWADTLSRISEARESRRLPPGVAAPIMFRIMDLTEAMRLRVERLT